MAELARAIGLELAEFKLGEPDHDNPDPPAATRSRLEQLLRVLWDMALEKNPAAIRCLLAYMEGTPPRQRPPLTKEEIETLSADVLAKLLEGAQAKLKQAGAEAWQQELTQTADDPTGKPAD